MSTQVCANTHCTLQALTALTYGLGLIASVIWACPCVSASEMDANPGARVETGSGTVAHGAISGKRVYMSAFAYPGAELQRIIVYDFGEEGWANIGVMFGTRDDMPTVYEWYQQSLWSMETRLTVAKPRDVARMVYVEDHAPEALELIRLWVRGSHDGNMGSKFHPDIVSLTRAHIGELDPLRLFWNSYSSYQGRTVAEEYPEVRMLVGSELPLPTVAARHERCEGTTSSAPRFTYRHQLRVLLAEEYRLDRRLQYPESVLCEMAFEEGLCPDHVTLELGFVCEQSPGEVAEYFLRRLRRLGVVEEREAEDNRGKIISLDQGGPHQSVLRIEAGEQSESRATPAQAIRDRTAAGTQYTWRVQKCVQ